MIFLGGGLTPWCDMTINVSVCVAFSKLFHRCYSETPVAWVNSFQTQTHTHTHISAGRWYHFSNQETMYLCMHPHTLDGYGHIFLSICVCLRICYIYSFNFTMNLRYAERVNCVQKEGCMLHIIVTAWSECLLITLWKQTLSKDLMIIMQLIGWIGHITRFDLLKETPRLPG